MKNFCCGVDSNSVGTHPTGWERDTRRPKPVHSGSKRYYIIQTTDRFVLRFTLHREHRTINLINVTLTIYKCIPKCTFQVQSQKHKYEVTNLHNLHYHRIRLHIITPPHMRVIVPEHKTRSAIPNNKPRDVPRQRVITIQTGPV